MLYTKCAVYWQVSSIIGGEGKYGAMQMGREREREREKQWQRWVHLDEHGGTAANQTISGFWINLCTVAC